MTNEDEKFLQELEAGLEGVTPGDWTFEPHGVTTALYAGRRHGMNGRHGLRLMNLDDGDRHFAENVAHIARCSPDNIRRLISLARSPSQTARASLSVDALEALILRTEPDVPASVDGNPMWTRRLAVALQKVLSALVDAPIPQEPVAWSFKLHPMETAPSGDDALEPAEIDVHEGAWAVLISTNAKRIGWIDTHATFAHRVYRDRVLAAAPPAPIQEKEGVTVDDAMDVFGLLHWFRSQGWMVAVHNDYRLDGRLHTFWLMTHPGGQWVKGEGVTDALALRAAMQNVPAALSNRHGGE